MKIEVSTPTSMISPDTRLPNGTILHKVGTSWTDPKNFARVSNHQGMCHLYSLDDAWFHWYGHGVPFSSCTTVTLRQVNEESNLQGQWEPCPKGTVFTLTVE